jgi:hypothetical protein
MYVSRWSFHCKICSEKLSRSKKKFFAFNWASKKIHEENTSELDWSSKPDRTLNFDESIILNQNTLILDFARSEAVQKKKNLLLLIEI